MKNGRIMLLAVAATALGAAGRAQAQDVMQVAKTHYKVLVENEHVRIVENTLAPGEKDSLHTHPAGWYYVTRGGKMKVVFADGRTAMWAPKTGDSEWGSAEAPHTSENVGDAPMSYVLVEVKSADATHAAARQPAPAKAKRAGSR